MNRMTSLFLAGWHNAGEVPRGCIHIEQADWVRPLGGDWMIQLEEAVLRIPTSVELVAHGLGCILVAAWASHSQNAQRVTAVTLWEPDDVEREDRRRVLKSWSPIPMQRIPFPSTVPGSRPPRSPDVSRTPTSRHPEKASGTSIDRHCDVVTDVIVAST